MYKKDAFFIFFCMICLLSFTSAPLISHCVGRFHCCWEIDMAEKLCMYKRAEKPERKKRQEEKKPTIHSQQLTEIFTTPKLIVEPFSVCLGVTGDKRWKFMFHNFLYTSTVHTTTKKKPLCLWSLYVHILFQHVLSGCRCAFDFPFFCACCHWFLFSVVVVVIVDVVTQQLCASVHGGVYPSGISFEMRPFFRSRRHRRTSKTNIPNRLISL